MKKHKLFRFFRTVHAWGGAVVALLMLLASISGSILVWKNEFVKMALVETNEEFTPAPNTTPQALAALAESVQDQFPANDIYLIQFPTEDFPLAKVTLADDRYAYLDTNGKIVAQWVLNERWEEWLYDLHHRLLLGNTGLTIVGFVAMTMVLLLIAGVITFWPMRRGFRHGFWPKTTARASLQAAHRNIGIVEALPFLLTLTTGAILAFPEQSTRLLLEPLRGEEYSLDFSENLDDITGPGTGDWLPAMERALATFPGSQIRTAQVPNDYSPYRVMGLQQPGTINPTGASKVYIEATEGWMDIRIDDQAQLLSERLYNLAYPLHTGRFDNFFYKVFLTVSGLAVAFLSALGLTSFAKQYIR